MSTYVNIWILFLACFLFLAAPDAAIANSGCSIIAGNAVLVVIGDEITMPHDLKRCLRSLLGPNVIGPDLNASWQFGCGISVAEKNILQRTRLSFL